MKNVYIIGGFDIHATALDEFALLKDGLAAKKYNVIPVNISWRRITPSEYAHRFIAEYGQSKASYNIIIGNSFGAIVGLLAAPNVLPDELYLCSLSPFFQEDSDKLPDSFGIKYFGKRRMAALRSLSAKELAEAVNRTQIKTTVLYGELEHNTSPALVNRCIETARDIQGSRLIELPSTPHDMDTKPYMENLLALF